MIGKQQVASPSVQYGQAVEFCRLWQELTCGSAQIVKNLTARRPVAVDPASVAVTLLSSLQNPLPTGRHSELLFDRKLAFCFSVEEKNNQKSNHRVTPPCSVVMSNLPNMLTNIHVLRQVEKKHFLNFSDPVTGGNIYHSALCGREFNHKTSQQSRLELRCRSHSIR